MNEFKKILDKAKEETNKELTNEIKSLSILSEDDINQIAPTDVDKAKLRELLLVLGDVTKTDESKTKIIKEIADTSKVIINIMERLI